MSRARPPQEEFLRLGGLWADLQDESAWTPGRPPKVTGEVGFHVAVRTETGRTLTGTLNAFAIGADKVEASPMYGKIVRWIPFGEPE